MSTRTEQAGHGALAAAERLRMASFGALTMVILQFAVGVSYNLYGTAPTASKSVAWYSSPLLGFHVTLGILILVTAAVLLYRAVKARSRVVIGISGLALLAVLGAFGAGSAFAHDGNNGSSLAMAICAAVAMLCYGANLVILGKPRG